MPLEPVAHGTEVVLVADEREGDHVDAHLHAGVDQPQVVLADGGERHRHVRQVESLAGGHRPAHLDLDLDLAVPGFADP